MRRDAILFEDWDKCCGGCCIEYSDNEYDDIDEYDIIVRFILNKYWKEP